MFIFTDGSVTNWLAVDQDGYYLNQDNSAAQSCIIAGSIRLRLRQNAQRSRCDDRHQYRCWDIY